MSFEGKVMLITGGNAGIGAACAEYFAKEGALLALVGRNTEKFEQLIGKFQDVGIELEPLVIIADVTVDAERIISETIEKYGRLDILINNAGICFPSTLQTVKMENYDTMMSTNIRAVVELSQLAVPHLIESKGNMINVSSVAGVIAIEANMPYSLTKAALNQFTKCVAMELADKGVRVNSINPGVIDTDVYSNFGLKRGTDEYAGFLELMKSMHPLQSVGTTDDCVNAVAFLAHDNARFITGTNLLVDGGIATKGGYHP